MPNEQKSIPGINCVEYASSIEVYLVEPALTHMQLRNMEGRSSEASSSMNVLGKEIRDIISNNDVHSADSIDALNGLTRDFDKLASDVSLGLVDGITFPDEPRVPGEPETVPNGNRTPENLKKVADAIRSAAVELVEALPFMSQDSVADYLSEGLLPTIESQVYDPEEPWASLSFSLENGDLVDFSHNIVGLDDNDGAQNQLARVSLALAVTSLEEERKSTLMALKRPDMDLCTANRMRSLGGRKSSEPTP